MIRINDRISYIPASDEPLSADIGMIRTGSGIWLYDTGNGDEALRSLEAADTADVRVVLSHFHPDHIGNLPRLAARECFVSANTRRYTGCGTVVETDIYPDDGIHIFPLPSSHAKGSLGLEIDETYAFVGDGTYACTKNGRVVYNAQLLLEELRVLRSLRAEYLLLSHRPEFVFDKAQIIAGLEEIYAARQDGEAYIPV